MKRVTYAAQRNVLTGRRSSLSLFMSFLIFTLFICSAGLLAADETGKNPAEAPGEIFQQARGRLQSAGYSEKEVHGVVEVLEDAAGRDIPPRLLLARVQEGAAKGVPALRLREALQQDVEYLAEARRILAELHNGAVLLSDTARWQRAATMLTAGLSGHELSELGRICIPVPGEFRSVSVLYASLVSWGLPSGTTLSVAEALTNSPLPAHEYEAVTDLYRNARRYRIAPEELSDRIISVAAKVADIEELERRILR